MVQNCEHGIYRCTPRRFILLASIDQNQLRETVLNASWFIRNVSITKEVTHAYQTARI